MYEAGGRIGAVIGRLAGFRGIPTSVFQGNSTRRYCATPLTALEEAFGAGWPIYDLERRIGIAGVVDAAVARREFWRKSPRAQMTITAGILRTRVDIVLSIRRIVVRRFRTVFKMGFGEHRRSNHAITASKNSRRRRPRFRGCSTPRGIPEPCNRFRPAFKRRSPNCNRILRVRLEPERCIR